jgi:hypothetical protein
MLKGSMNKTPGRLVGYPQPARIKAALIDKAMHLFLENWVEVIMSQVAAMEQIMILQYFLRRA